jgi:large exoprotein involved in heme utilization and adhesion
LTVNAFKEVQLIGTSADGQFASGLFTSFRGTGNTGYLAITTRQLQVLDGAIVSVRSFAGQAGNLTIIADSLLLNRGSLIAETAKNGENGANINLSLDLLHLDNESLISANAFNQANGGNILIESTFIIVLPPTGSNGSDIIANAIEGNGGRLGISTFGMFGIQARPQLTPKNDITSSNFDLSDKFQQVDPTQGVMNLPTTLAHASLQIDQSCSAEGRLANRENSFTISGRGGLPQSPTEIISPDMVQDDLGTPVAIHPAMGESVKPSPASHPKQLVEAQGWVVDDYGKIALVATAQTATPHSSWQKPVECHTVESPK